MTESKRNDNSAIQGDGLSEATSDRETSRPAEEGRDSDCYFGVCPQCGFTDGYLNIYRAHFFVCHPHKVRWLAGENLFSSWRFESSADWQTNWDQIKAYAEITPRYPDANEEP